MMRGAERRCGFPLRGARCLAQWFLCLADAAPECPLSPRRGAEREDQDRSFADSDRTYGARPGVARPAGCRISAGCTHATTIHQLGPPTIMLKGDRVGPTKQEPKTRGLRHAMPEPSNQPPAQGRAPPGIIVMPPRLPPPMSLPGAQSPVGDQAPHTCPANDQKLELVG